MKLYEYPPKLLNPDTAIIDICVTEDDSDPDATLKISFEVLTGDESKSFETFKKILLGIIEQMKIRRSDYMIMCEGGMIDIGNYSLKRR